jgi:hypothetical protein
VQHLQALCGTFDPGAPGGQKLESTQKSTFSCTVHPETQNDITDITEKNRVLECRKKDSISIEMQFGQFQNIVCSSMTLPYDACLNAAHGTLGPEEIHGSARASELE